MAATLSRPLPGSRQHNFYPTRRDTSVSSLDSAFQLQEYLAHLIQADPHDIRRIVSLPKSLSTTEEDRGDAGFGSHEEEREEREEHVDENCWIYEQLRRLAQDLNHPLITTLQQECTRETCPEMKAGEWLFLCVAHGNGPNVEKCCAIDYILHTIDSATALLNSPRAFPSRISIPPTSHRHFSSLARRLGRIFGHAYYQHREAFEQSEAETSLYSRFLALAAMYDLVPPDFLDIPPRETMSSDEEISEIEISRAPSMELGGRRNPSPLTRSRTDTMIRAEGFVLPTEEFEEHIPQPEEMEPVELPTSFYHEREASPPTESSLQPEPTPTETHEDEPRAKPECTEIRASEPERNENVTAHEVDFTAADPAIELPNEQFQTPTDDHHIEDEDFKDIHHIETLEEAPSGGNQQLPDSGAPKSVDEPHETSIEPPQSQEVFVSIPVSGDGTDAKTKERSAAEAEAAEQTEDHDAKPQAVTVEETSSSTIEAVSSNDEGAMEEHSYGSRTAE